MTDPVAHRAAEPVVHDGPGHRFSDPSWCAGCWWEQIGQWQPQSEVLTTHAADCLGCAARPLVYTDVETHRASLRERVQVVRLMWHVANTLPAKKRRKVKRATVAEYLRPRARVTYYLASLDRPAGRE